MLDGYKTKYALTRADGSPVDPDGEYFTLKLNSKDPNHAIACCMAALKYAEYIEPILPQLAADMEYKAAQYLGEAQEALLSDLPSWAMQASASTKIEDHGCSKEEDQSDQELV
jgi:hypothetical protein